MNQARVIALTVLVVSGSPHNSMSQPVLNDPYEIIQRQFAACGGIDLLRADQNRYFEGTIAIGGLTGTLKVWNKKPDLSRTEVDLGVFKITEGTSPELSWSADGNGKVQIKTKPNETALKRKEVRRRMADYQYADRNSDFFVVSGGNTENIDGRGCYVVNISNKLNSDTRTDYINTGTFLIEKSILVEGEVTTTTASSDYRSVGELLIPFQIKQTDQQTGQTQELTITRYESDTAIDSRLFEPPRETGTDFRFAKGSSAENIKFQYRGKHLYLPVMVKCKERWWILDTGAEMTVIDRAFAEELGLEISGSMAGKGAGGSVDVAFTTLPPFSLSGVEFDQQQVAVIDMGSLNRSMDVKSCGILGFDFLSRFVSRIDYANESLSLFDPATFTYSGNGRQIDAHIKDRLFIIPATLDGNPAGSWMVDIGASLTSLSGAWALRHGYRERPGVERMGKGAGQEYRAKSIRCEKLTIGGLVIDRPMVSLDVTGSDTTTVSDEMGILGNSVFQNLVMYCDYAKERIIVEPGSNFNKPWQEDHSGLQLMRGANDEVQVWFVATGTPAAKGGFAKDDIIRSINGVDTKHLEGLIPIRALFSGTPGTVYDVVVERNGKTENLKLKLAVLL